MINATIFVNKQSVPAPLFCGVFCPFPSSTPASPISWNKTTLFLLLIITSFPWDPMSTNKGHAWAFGSKVMSPPKILLTLSLLVMRGALDSSTDAVQSCSAIAKTLVCHQHLSSYQSTALWELLWGKFTPSLKDPKYAEILRMSADNSNRMKKGRMRLNKVVTAREVWGQTAKIFTKCLTEKWRSFHSRLYHSALHCVQHSSKRLCPYDLALF